MKRKIALLSMTLLVAAATIACSASPPATEPINLVFDFRNGAQEWESGFAEYSPEHGDLQFESGLRPLPEELGPDGTGYYIQGMNRPDDLFMFLKRGLGTEDGIVPGQEYRIIYTLIFASNAPSGAVGIGGAPGEGVFVKAGASPIEPEAILEDDYYVMTVDKGGGNSGEGPAASIAGDFANGLDAEEIDWLNPPYVAVELEHEHIYTVTASEDGDLWLLVGTDSGFEGLTGIYYISISVTLAPVQ